MKILIIGGTYFLGPAFIRRALEQGHEITVFNRGTRKTGLGSVKEIKGDRSVYEDLVRARGDYDAVVDFCAYKKGDIDRVRKALDGNAYRYVFISTVDVYRRNTGEVLTEDAEFETRDFGGEAGAYILGKAALEKEVLGCDDYCCLRPSVIYGPGNYAPRENIYFRWISAAGQILEPVPSDGFFQTVWSYDVARCILRACGDEEFSRRAFNVTPGDLLTYRDYTAVLRAATGREFEVIGVTPEEAFMQQVPFPFPISAAESEKYDGSALERAGFEYTDITEGMRKTWEYYVHSI